MQFAQPAQPGSFKVADYNGRLVLIDVLSLEKDMQTSFGISDAIRADVVVLDGPGAPIEEDNALLFGRALVSSLTPLVGQKTLGRIGQGTAKAGQSAPWVLGQHTESDAAIATAYITARTQAGFNQPAAAPVAAPAAAPAPAAFNPQAQNIGNTPVGQTAAANPAALELLTIGYSAEQVQGLINAGQDLQAVLALAKQVGATPAA